PASRAVRGSSDARLLPFMFNLLPSPAAPFYAIGPPPNPPAGSFPSGARQFLGATSLAQAYIDPDPHRNYVLQWTLNVQRSLAKNLTLEVSYADSRGIHQPFRPHELNLVLPQPAPTGYA